jgi:hypothetical protein
VVGGTTTVAHAGTSTGTSTDTSTDTTVVSARAAAVAGKLEKGVKQPWDKGNNRRKHGPDGRVDGGAARAQPIPSAGKAAVKHHVRLVR